MAAIRTYHVPGKPGLAVDVAGAGECAFFLHGIGGNRTNWTEQLVGFGDGFRAVAWDARGYNGSEDYEGPLDFSDFSRDLARTLDWLGVQKAHLIGLSMGGRIAQDFVALHPGRVATLTLVATLPSFGTLTAEERARFVELRTRPLREGKLPRDMAPAVTKTLSGPNATPEQVQRLIASMAALRSDSYVKTVEASMRYDRDADLERIAVPTLLVFGENDSLTRPEIGAAMHKRIRGSEYVVVPGAGHLINLEKPAAFDAAVLGFLRKHKGRGA